MYRDTYDIRQGHLSALHVAICNRKRLKGNLNILLWIVIHMAFTNLDVVRESETALSIYS
jgi:hypothetical protein